MKSNGGTALKHHCHATMSRVAVFAVALLFAAQLASAQPDAGAELPSITNSAVMREANKLILADPVDRQARHTHE